jgi:hypothetical protein
MEIKIQLEKNLLIEDVIGTPVVDEKDIDIILGEVISYDTITGIGICSLKEKSDDQDHHFIQDVI